MENPICSRAKCPSRITHPEQRISLYIYIRHGRYKWTLPLGFRCGSLDTSAFPLLSIPLFLHTNLSTTPRRLFCYTNFGHQVYIYIYIHIVYIWLCSCLAAAFYSFPPHRHRSRVSVIVLLLSLLAQGCIITTVMIIIIIIITTARGVHKRVRDAVKGTKTTVYISLSNNLFVFQTSELF